MVAPQLAKIVAKEEIAHLATDYTSLQNDYFKQITMHKQSAKKLKKILTWPATASVSSPSSVP